MFSGIISAIAFSPTHTGMLATGSYNQTTAIYREDNMESLYVLHGQEGGVTHVSEKISSRILLDMNMSEREKSTQALLSSDMFDICSTGTIFKRW